MATILTRLPGDAIRIKECHVNVWTLPAFLGELHYIDIGLWMENAGKANVSQFQIGVPAELDDRDAYCLVTRIRDALSWQLVFPDVTQQIQQGPAYSDQTLLRAGLGQFPLTRVTVARQEGEDLGRDFSLWAVRLTRPLPPGETTYVRFRFATRGTADRPFGCLQRSKDLWVFERVKTYDIRVNETREQPAFAIAAHLIENLPEIGIVRVFLITGGAYSPRAMSPDPRHTRLLEGGVWEDYLQRRLTVFPWSRPPKLVIYSFKSPWEDASKEEFRTFASLHRDLGRMDLPTLAITVLVAAVAIVAAGPEWAKDVSREVRQFVDRNTVEVLGALLIFVLVYLLVRLYDPLVHRRRRLVDWADRTLYGLRRGAR